jgi:hypothetical protein
MIAVQKRLRNGAIHHHTEAYLGYLVEVCRRHAVSILSRDFPWMLVLKGSDFASICAACARERCVGYRHCCMGERISNVGAAGVWGDVWEALISVPVYHDSC